MHATQQRKKKQARSALSAIEAFAMEREDAVTKLAHEKEELLEELKGARSGQDRSAEEVGSSRASLPGGKGREGKKFHVLLHVALWMVSGWW